QPDNARRVVRLGVARTIPRAKYGAGRLATELGELLRHQSYANAAEQSAAELAKEDGVRSACDGLEAALR
ncbi:MAG: rhamnosyltransferase subunit, partial [Bryobacterales bacterium]|nr:rhamnosyltransferase subunit [Bryobacterales bacterium]